MLRTAIEIGSRVGGALAGLRKLEDRQTRLGRTLQKTRRQAVELRGRAVELRSTPDSGTAAWRVAGPRCATAPPSCAARSSAWATAPATIGKAGKRRTPARVRGGRGDAPRTDAQSGGDGANTIRPGREAVR